MILKIYNLKGLIGFKKVADTLFMKKDHEQVKDMGTRTFMFSQYGDLLSIAHTGIPILTSWCNTSLCITINCKLLNQIHQVN